MYRVAPVDTWAVFVQADQEHLAKKLLNAFRRCMAKIDSSDSVTKAPKIFTVPWASGAAGLRAGWQAALIDKVRVHSKMQAQVVLLINPVKTDATEHAAFTDEMRHFFAS